MSTVDEALVDVILDEMRGQRYTAAEMQRRTGIKSRTWQNYFVQRTRAVPIKAVYAIASVLELPGHELMQRAEERAAAMDGHEDRAEAALRRASPSAQRRGRKLAREVRSQPEEEAPADQTGGSGVVRSASTGA